MNTLLSASAQHSRQQRPQVPNDECHISLMQLPQICHWNLAAALRVAEGGVIHLEWYRTVHFFEG